MRGGPRIFRQDSSCPGVLWIPPRRSILQVRGFHPLRPAFPKPFPWMLQSLVRSEPRGAAHPGLGPSHFARRYSRNRCFFLFLRLLRCFSSPGSLPCVMDWRTDTQVFPVWVSPFRNPRISGHVLLPAAYRSLSRLSSALSAKASALCPFCLASSVPACSSVCRRNATARHKMPCFCKYIAIDHCLDTLLFCYFAQSTEI